MTGEAEEEVEQAAVNEAVVEEDQSGLEAHNKRVEGSCEEFSAIMAYHDFNLYVNSVPTFKFNLISVLCHHLNKTFSSYKMCKKEPQRFLVLKYFF